MQHSAYVVNGIKQLIDYRNTLRNFFVRQGFRKAKHLNISFAAGRRSSSVRSIIPVIVLIGAAITICCDASNWVCSTAIADQQSMVSHALGSQMAPPELHSVDARPYLDIGLRMDGLAVLMSIVITAIGGGIISYANGYLDGKPSKPFIITWLLVFMAAMVTLVNADNLLLLAHGKPPASLRSCSLALRSRSLSSLRAMLITGGGGSGPPGGLIFAAQGRWGLDLL